MSIPVTLVSYPERMSIVESCASSWRSFQGFRFFNELFAVLLAGFFASIQASIDRKVVQGPMGLEEIDGARVLFLSGTPEEMGRCHGEALRDQINSGLEHFVLKSESVFGVSLDVMRSVSEKLKPHIPDHCLAEAEGIACGAGITLDDVLLINTMIDADAIYVQGYFNCTNFIVGPPATIDGGFIHGRNLDFPNIDLLEGYGVVIVRHPSERDRRPTMCVTWCGHLGGLTVYNASRIAASHVMAPTSEAITPGVPMAVLIREVLERADSVEEVFDRVSSQPRTAGFNLAVSDGKTGQGIAIELTRRLAERRRLRKGLLITDNVSLCARTSHNRLTHAAGAFRYARLMTLMKEHNGNIDAERCMAFMSDRYDVAFDSTVSRTYNSICNHHTIQSAVFDHRTGEAHIAMGTSPAPVHGYSRIPLSIVDTGCGG